MNIECEVLRARPRIVFVVDRDSVCAGDDCEAHKITVQTLSFIDPVRLAEELSSPYLPSVAGYGHWWECILNGNVIAKISSDGKAEKAGEVNYLKDNTVYFRYHSATY